VRSLAPARTPTVQKSKRDPRCHTDYQTLGVPSREDRRPVAAAGTGTSFNFGNSTDTQRIEQVGAEASIVVALQNPLAASLSHVGSQVRVCKKV